MWRLPRGGLPDCDWDWDDGTNDEHLDGVGGDACEGDQAHQAELHLEPPLCLLQDLLKLYLQLSS